MKFLLCAVNAKYIHSNPAVYSLRAYAGERLRPYVEIAEYTINQQKDEILADLYRRKPAAIGFSCYIWNWTVIRELVCEVRKILPDTDIWLGGPEVSYDAAEILTLYPWLKGVMIGEGEATFRELLQYYADKADGLIPESEEAEETERLKAIAGLCLPDGYTAPRGLTDINEIPFLYEELESFENRIIYYESGRGCPYRCSYCLSSLDKKVRLRDLALVQKELQFFLDRKVPQVKFVDRTFNCDHKHAMGIWTYLLEHDNGVTNFHFEISGDLLRAEEIALLGKMRPGLVQLEIGVQSVNPRTIGAINRVMDVERLEKNTAAIRENHNIHQHLDLIAGLPFEDYESFGRSYDRVYSMRPQQLQLGFLKVLKGSPMQEKAEEYGISFHSSPPYEILSSGWLTYGDVLRLKKIEEMTEVYYNSGQFAYTLPFLEKAFSSPFAMFEALADFYEAGGYLTNSSARVCRYLTLLDFAVEKDPAHKAVYRELLTFDLYLREKLKSRPDFAADLTPYKESIREFYREEEQERRYLPDYEGYDSRQLAKMTHLEPFLYPVWDRELLLKEREGFGERKLTYVLFDYRHRDPLTYEAKIQMIGKERGSCNDGFLCQY